MTKQKKEKRRNRIYPYLQAMPVFLRYQAASKLLLAVILYLLRQTALRVLHSAGRTAVSSGDLRFIFTSWQGIVLLLLGALTLLVYTGLDLNIKILLSGKMLRGEKEALIASIRECLVSLKKFLSPVGLLIILYTALLAPTIGFGLSISLTEDLYIPRFITSVIQTTPLYYAAYITAEILFVALGFFGFFSLYGIILDNIPASAAVRQSFRLVRKNRRDYLKQNLQYLFTVILFFIVIVLTAVPAPLIIAYSFDLPHEVQRLVLIIVCMSLVFLLGLGGLMLTPLYIMKMTRVYVSYTEEKEVNYPLNRRRENLLLFLRTAFFAMMVFGLSWIMNGHFDEIFPASAGVPVIAHRASGSEGTENTVSGIDTVYQLGAYGSEIDIQRTKDGAYVLNHDNTFERVAGDSRRPSEMTMEEIRKLSVRGEPVSTLEEMLEACRGKVTLFIELKGDTADRQMADDTVRIVKEAGMQDQCVLISLKYDLIDYIETTYPEMETGCLTFVSFGNIASLNCDYIGLEEECATYQLIEAIHEKNKKVLVWTVNEESDQKNFMLMNIDGMITDNVRQAMEVKSRLENRTDLERIVDTLFMNE